MKGIVRRLLAEKGYGFINGVDGKDYFFHRDSFQGHWDDLQIDFQGKEPIRVEFEVEQSPKGPRANTVRRLDHPNQ